jgi:hypothetical protein
MAASSALLMVLTQAAVEGLVFVAVGFAIASVAAASVAYNSHQSAYGQFCNQCQ